MRLLDLAAALCLLAGRPAAGQENGWFALYGGVGGTAATGGGALAYMAGLDVGLTDHSAIGLRFLGRSVLCAEDGPCSADSKSFDVGATLRANPDAVGVPFAQVLFGFTSWSPRGSTATDQRFGVSGAVGLDLRMSPNLSFRTLVHHQELLGDDPGDAIGRRNTGLLFGLALRSR